VPIFGRSSARQRLRRATRESLAIPAFSSPVDCAPWVLGGLWPIELSAATGENAVLAGYLKADLQRIAGFANDELMKVRRAGLTESARQAHEARVVDEARARAVRRVDSTVRQLRLAPRELSTGRVVRADVDEQQVPPAVTAGPPDSGSAKDARTDLPTEVFERPLVEPASDDAQRVRPEALQASALQPEPAAEAEAEIETEDQRLQRLLSFVVRQEPRLNWAVGDYPDGTTTLVTDLAHGWIPPGIVLPAGVRLLEPDRRTGKAAALLGETTRAATYSPGDPPGRAPGTTATGSSLQPRELPMAEDLGWDLGEATHWRDGLPRMVHTLAKAAAAGTGVVQEELDLLRVHLDTALYQLLLQYPNVDPALVLNCLLLAATEALVTADPVTANYHLAWFRNLEAPPASQWTATP